MKKIIIIALLAVLVMDIYADNLKQKLTAIGIYSFDQPMDIVDFELEDLQGKKHKLSDYKDKVVFLNFWASWCGPCRAEMPSMQELENKFGPEGFKILAINLKESQKIAGDFMKREKLDFTVLLDKNGAIGSAYGARSIPTTYIIGRDSKVIGGILGSRPWSGDDVEDAFNQLLNQ